MALAHALWAASDARVPWDLGIFYIGLQQTWEVVDQPSRWPMAWENLARAGGWYTGLLAVFFTLLFTKRGNATSVKLALVAGFLTVLMMRPWIWPEGK